MWRLAALLFSALVFAVWPLWPPVDISYIKIDKAQCPAVAPPNCAAYSAAVVLTAHLDGAFTAYVNTGGEWRRVLSASFGPGCRRAVLTFVVPNGTSAMRFNASAGERWVQGMEIQGIDAVCIAAYKPPSIERVEVDGEYRISVYINAPGINNTVTLEVGGLTQSKKVELGVFAGSPCTTLRVDFGPYAFPPGRYNGKVTIHTGETKEFSFEVPISATTMTTRVTTTITVTTTELRTTVITTTVQPPQYVTSYITQRETVTNTLIVKEVDWGAVALVLTTVLAAFALGVLAHKKSVQAL
ncbi:MAG: hypothetical protein ABWK05_08290 [Pyrobaculum sp.]